MNCFFCHNRALIGRDSALTSIDWLWDFLKKRRKSLDGVVISGGEPTMQKDLVAFIKDTKSLGYKVKLDTNGSNPHVLETLLHMNLLDYVAIDYKAPWKQYPAVCRYLDVGALLATFEILKSAKISWEARTTMLPHLTKEEYLEMAESVFILPRYVLNQYRIPVDFAESDRFKIQLKPFTKEKLATLKDAIKAVQPNTTLA
jgi:pyruvate formate lyase activating enzyme